MHKIAVYYNRMPTQRNKRDTSKARECAAEQADQKKKENALATARANYVESTNKRRRVGDDGAADKEVVQKYVKLLLVDGGLEAEDFSVGYEAHTSHEGLEVCSTTVTMLGGAKEGSNILLLLLLLLVQLLLVQLLLVQLLLVQLLLVQLLLVQLLLLIILIVIFLIST
jgi:hypothetical protein